jgi:1-acyl-sn-glycerol-3-phosphate acyltransferase
MQILRWLSALPRFAFHLLVIRPVVLFVLGLNVRHRERLRFGPGPLILAPNHNSHLDTLVVSSLVPLAQLHRVRAVAAADYWLKTPLRAWFALNLIGILPLRRERSHPDEDLLAPVEAALRRNEILIFFPEGTRGDPEVLQPYKSGLARLLERVPETQALPVFTHGLGKALPRGTALLVPVIVDVFIGEPLEWTPPREAFMQRYADAMHALSVEQPHAPWL